MMNEYLITGGAGFVGSHLADRLVSEGHRITIVDNLSNGSTENLQTVIDQIEFINMNVNKVHEVLSKKTFDGIFHLATAPRSSSLNDPFTDIETNCKGMIAVLEAARKTSTKVVFTSNSGIYGAVKKGHDSINETYQNNPTTPYDADKLVSEYYCKIYNTIYNTRSAIVRFATVYGPRQKVNESLNWKPLIATFIQRMKKGLPIHITGNGNQTRDLIYVKDAVDGVIKAMYSKENSAEVFILGTHKQTSVNEVFEKITKHIPYDKRPEYVDPLPGDIMTMKYSYVKAQSRLGFAPKYSLDDGIKEMI